MILINTSGQFELTYNGGSHIIPNGEFNVDEELGLHILYIARKWGKNVVDKTIPQTPAQSKRIQLVEVEDKEEEEATEDKEPEKIDKVVKEPETKVKTKVEAKKK